MRYFWIILIFGCGSQPLKTSFITADSTIVLKPQSGDNYQQIQAAIAYQLQTPGVEVVLSVGTYPISHPLVFGRLVNGIYQQCTPRFRGAINAKNCPDPQRTSIVAEFSEGPAIAVQLAKGGYIKDIALKGQYTLPNALTQIQIDTLRSEDWGGNAATPYTGIGVDYYYNGSNSGSTAFTTEGVSIQNFDCGFNVSVGGSQNGEIIHLYHSLIDHCKTAYALCQAQSKQNEVKDLECWGSVFTVFDNMTYGVRHGDGAGSPMVDGVNIAGGVHQIFNIVNYAFQGTFRNIYGELIYKIGRIGGNAGALVSSLDVGFSSADYGRPSPDYFIYANNTLFENCSIRFYSNEKKISRFPLNGQNNEFHGGQMNAPPQYSIYGGSPVYPPRISGMVMYAINGVINTNNYDVFNWLTVSNIHVNSDFSGWFTRGGKDPSQQRGDFSKVKPGDLLITEYNMRDINLLSWNYPLGYVQKITGDTVYLQNIGVGIPNGIELVINDFGYK